MRKTLFFLLFFPFGVLADYCATSAFKGHVCKGFIVEACSFYSIDAVKGDDGRMYHPKECYDSVTEHDAGDNRCWINLESKGLGIISGAINMVKEKPFYSKVKGEFKNVDPDYLTFKCLNI